MKNELDPRIAYAVLGTLAALVIGLFIWRLRGPSFQPQTTGSEPYMRRYEQTGRFYEPPPNSPAPNPYAGRR